MSESADLRPQHIRRPGEEILAALQANAKALVTAISAAYNVALALDADLKEIYERQLYRRVWGYTSMEAFCQGELDASYNAIRHRVARVYRDRELAEGGLQPGGLSQLDRREHRLGTGRNPSGRLPDRPLPPTEEERYRREVRDLRRTGNVQYGPRKPTLLIPPAPIHGAPSAQEPILPVRTGVPVLPTPEVLDAPPAASEAVIVTANAIVGWLCSIMGQIDPGTAIDDATEAELATMTTWVEQWLVAGRARSFCEHHPDERSPDGKVCTGCGKQVLR